MEQIVSDHVKLRELEVQIKLLKSHSAGLEVSQSVMGKELSKLKKRLLAMENKKK